MTQVPEKIGGIKRLLRAVKFSLQGFMHGIKNEPAFRQEFVVSIILLPIAFFLEIPLAAKIFIFFCHFLTMITELLNSAIESIADLVSSEFNQLIKQAKDMGSLAVLFTIILTIVSWVYAVSFLIK